MNFLSLAPGSIRHDELDRPRILRNEFTIQFQRFGAAPPAALIGRLRAVIPAPIAIELVFDGPAEPGLRGERIARGAGMRDRTIKAQAEAKQHFDSYIREQAHAGGGAADELHKLNELKEKGALSPDEFEKAKAKLLA